MSQSDPNRTCPECGLELPGSQMAQGCPGCSLRLALAGDAEPRGGLPGMKSRFFGDYELIEEVARGGMGVVYRARELGISRIVALKMVPSHQLLSDEARLRLRVEIEAVSQLHHPNIVPLYGSGEHDGTHYFTMRLLEGGDLAQYLQTPHPIRQSIQLLVHICRAVHYAHQRGVLHRDLKPSNILLDEERNPYVADFGLAKTIDHDSGFTFTHSVLGSPNYMAPEQASGHNRQLTTAVDVYGLGAILYHLIAGRPPFQADSPIATLRRVVDEEPEPPRSWQPGADRELETIALKCLRKDPNERYHTADDLARELERWLEGRPILARPTGPFTLAWRWSRRHPVAALLGLCFILALLGVVVSTAIAAVRIQKAELRATEQLGRALVSEARALRIRGEWGNRGEGLRLLHEAAPLLLAPEARLRARNEMLGLLAIPDMPFARDEFLPAPRPASYRLDPGFTRAAYLLDGTNVVIHDPGTGTPLSRIQSELPVTQVDRFSPTGQFLALRHAHALSIWDLSTSRRCWTGSGTNLVYAFSPRNGEMVWQASPNETVFLQLPEGREIRRWRLDPTRPGGRSVGWHTLSISPDGKTIAGASAVSHLVELMDVETGQALRLLTNSPRTTAMAWSPNGKQFAVATGIGRIYVWDPVSGNLQWTLASLPGRAHSIAFSPRDPVLAVACEDQRLRLLDLQEHRLVFETVAESPLIKFSKDGERLGPFRVGGDLGWFQPNQSAEHVEFDARMESERLSGSRFSEDSKLLAVGHSTAAALCDPDEGQVIQSLVSFRMPALVFHPLTNAILTGNSPGIVRFAVDRTRNPALSRAFEVLVPPRNWRALDITPDGQRLAAFNGRSNAVFLFDATFTNVITTFGPHREAEDIAISADGQWVATGSYDDKSVRTWDVARQSLAKVFEVGPRPQSAFSRDGKWLATFGDTFGLWHTGSWKPAPPLTTLEGPVVWGAAAFSADSRILAVVANLNSVHLFDLRALEPIGILRPSGAIRIRSLAFAPDRTKIAAIGSEGRVAIWHLQKIRQRLAEMNLHSDLL